MAPLYGGDISVGVRELIQNAVDACNERTEWERRHGLPPTTKGFEVHVEIVKRPDGTAHIMVRDEGIGMTPEIIVDYYLTAGASFRTSMAWKREFTDEKGHSSIMRGGRFGVGALAAFLLGDEIELTTRHCSQQPDKAVSFCSKLDASVVELRHGTAPIGTTILVPIKETHRIRALLPNEWHINNKPKTIKGDHWRQVDWFCVGDPPVRVTITIGDWTASLDRAYRLPSANQTLLPGWNRVVPEGYADVHWTFARSAPPLTVNGIVVQRRFATNSGDEVLHYPNTPPYLCRPSLSVFDPDGIFPLNLQRSGPAGFPAPIDELLIPAVCHDAVAYLAVSAPLLGANDGQFIDALRSLGDCPNIEFRHRNGSALQCIPYGIGRKGMTLLSSETLKAGGVQRIFGLPASQFSTALLEILPEDSLFLLLLLSEVEPDLLRWTRLALGGPRAYGDNVTHCLESDHGRLHLKPSHWNFSKAPKRVAKSVLYSHHVERSTSHGIVIATSKSMDGLQIFDSIRAELSDANSAMLEWRLSAVPFVSAMGNEKTNPLPALFVSDLEGPWLSLDDKARGLQIEKLRTMVPQCIAGHEHLRKRKAERAAAGDSLESA